MKTAQVAWMALGGATLLVVFAGRAATAPAPAKPADKWEYAEIHYSSARNFRGGADELPRRGGRGDFRGGGAPGGGAASAQPAPAAQPALRRLEDIRWISGDGEIVASSWEELASKLKASAAKPGAATPVVHKLRVLNHLGSQGWEMVSAGTSNTSPWVFKRKVAK
jgi:hypothetical protein